ncbi:MAG: hypothetical protein MZV49_24505 [Rhodopseudomonas palustris]|nr:hypothetical protein [Rhodopseudomonas palustris]
MLLAYVLQPAITDTALLVLGVGTLVTIADRRRRRLGRHDVRFTSAGRDAARLAAAAAARGPDLSSSPTSTSTCSSSLRAGPVARCAPQLPSADKRRRLLVPSACARSPGAGILLLGLVLYPYVYLAAQARCARRRAAQASGSRARPRCAGCVTTSRRDHAAAGAAGAGGRRRAGGCSKRSTTSALSEYLGVRSRSPCCRSLTTWLNRGSLPGAAQLALADCWCSSRGLIALERIAAGASRVVFRDCRPGDAGSRRAPCCCSASVASRGGAR